MSSRDLFEEGDTGEAILPAKVNGTGVHADRDRSEAPPAGNPLHGTPAAEGAAATLVDQLRAENENLSMTVQADLIYQRRLEAKLARVEDILKHDGQWYSGPLLCRTIQAALAES